MLFRSQGGWPLGPPRGCAPALGCQQKTKVRIFPSTLLGFCPMLKNLHMPNFSSIGQYLEVADRGYAFFKTPIALALAITGCHALICSNTYNLAQIAHAPEEGLLDVKLVQLVTTWDKIKTSIDLLLHQRACSITFAVIGRNRIESLRYHLIAQTLGFLCPRSSSNGCFTRSESQPEHFMGLKLFAP